MFLKEAFQKILQIVSSTTKEIKRAGMQKLRRNSARNVTSCFIKLTNQMQDSNVQLSKTEDTQSKLNVYKCVCVSVKSLITDPKKN